VSSWRPGGKDPRKKKEGGETGREPRPSEKEKTLKGRKKEVPATESQPPLSPRGRPEEGKRKKGREKTPALALLIFPRRAWKGEALLSSAERKKWGKEACNSLKLTISPSAGGGKIIGAGRQGSRSFDFEHTQLDAPKEGGRGEKVKHAWTPTCCSSPRISGREKNLQLGRWNRRHP